MYFVLIPQPIIEELPIGYVKISADSQNEFID